MQPPSSARWRLWAERQPCHSTALGRRRRSGAGLFRSIREMTPMKILDPLLVDCAVLARYLIRLENTAQLISRLEALENRFNLLRDEFKEFREIPHQFHQEIQAHERMLPSIEPKLDRSESPKVKRGGVKDDQVDIEGDCYGGCLKWKFEVGDHVKEGQVVAILCLPGRWDVECGAIGSPGDGVLVERLFGNGANLYGPSIIIGRIRTS